MCANGWMAGLVTSSACAGHRDPRGSDPYRSGRRDRDAVAGGTAGAGSVDRRSLGRHYPCMPLAGYGDCSRPGCSRSRPDSCMAQLVGIATLLGLVFPLVYLLFAIVNRMIPFRVDTGRRASGHGFARVGRRRLSGIRDPSGRILPLTRCSRHDRGIGFSRDA